MTIHPHSPETRLPQAKTSSAFAMLALVQATLIFTIALIMVPLPHIARDFGLAASDILWLQVAYGLPFSGLLLFGGRLADRYGGRRIFILGLAGFGLASLAAAAAPSYGVLVTARFAQGIAGALTAPAAIAVLRALFPDAAGFGRAMASWGGVSVLGAILGFVLSGIVTAWLSWRVMFCVPIVVALAGLAAAFRLMPAAAPGESLRPRLDLPGAALATAGIVLGSYGLIATGDHRWLSPSVLVPLAGAAFLLLAFLVVERRASDPLLPPGFVADPCRFAGLVGMLLAAAGSVVIEYVLSLYLQQLRGWTPLATALAFLPFAVTLIAANQLSPAAVDRVGPVPATVAGLTLAAFGLGLLSMIGADTDYAVGLLPGMVLLAGGLSLTFSGSAVLSTMKVPQHQAGLAGGVMNTAMELGPTMGLAVLMAVAATQIETVRGYGWAFAAASLFFVAAAILTVAGTSRGSCATTAETAAGT